VKTGMDVDEVSLNVMLSYGFEKNLCIQALLATTSIDDALEWLGEYILNN
jgi:uncharacterized UBP type Zn finger protein